MASTEVVAPVLCSQMATAPLQFLSACQNLSPGCSSQYSMNFASSFDDLEPINLYTFVKSIHIYTPRRGRTTWDRTRNLELRSLSLYPVELLSDYGEALSCWGNHTNPPKRIDAGASLLPAPHERERRTHADLRGPEIGARICPVLTSLQE